MVREKELGTLEQLNVTPLTRTELIVGKLVPYGLVGLIDVLLVLAVAILWFEVPMRGSYMLLFASDAGLSRHHARAGSARSRRSRRPSSRR